MTAEDGGTTEPGLRRNGAGRIRFREFTAEMAQALPYSGIGADLRAERERRGLTLESVARDLRLQPAHLAALEEGQVDDLPGAAYAIGFLRSYARFLDMDAEAAVRRFKEEDAVRADPTRLVFPEPIGEPRRPGWRLAFISLLLFAAAYGGWTYLQYQGDLSLEEISPVPESMQNLLSSSGDDAQPAAGDKIEATAGAAGPQPVATADAETARSDDGAADSAPSDGESGTSAAQTSPFLPTEGAMRITTVEPTRVEIALREGEKAVAEQAEPTTESREGERVAAADATGVAGDEAVPGSPVPAATDPSGERSTGGEPESGPSEREAAATAPTTETDDGAGDAASADVEPVAPSRPVAEAVPVTSTGGTGSAPREEPAAGARMGPGEQSNNIGSGNATDGAGRLRTAMVDSASPSAAAAPPSLTVPAQTAATSSSGDAPPPAAEPVASRRPQSFGVADANARVIIRARADSWVQVQGPNNELLLTRVLRAGDAYYAPDRDDLLLMTGNAGAIEVIVDGEVLGRLGPEGEVRRDVNLSADNIAGNLFRRNPSSP